MTFFISVIKGTLSILNIPFNLFGYTMTFYSIGIWFAAVAAMCFMIRKFMD